jgi:hypothetical protein
MLYRDVPSSFVQPISSVQENGSIEPLEVLFNNYFFKKGQQSYQEYKSSSMQSNSTFLKDLFNNISSIIKNKNLDEKERLHLTLIINSIQNQLILLEETIGKIDIDSLNAAIAGTFLRHIKKHIS